MAKSQTKKDPIISPAFHPLAVGDKGDVRASPEQISAIVSILIDAGICCCFVQEYALVYYGTSRLPNDRILCVPDEQHQRAVELFTCRDDILKPCGPLPLRRPDLLNYKYPRFKAIGRTNFWLLLPASYCHISCEPDNIEWSQGNLPYPKLPFHTQSLLYTHLRQPQQTKPTHRKKTHHSQSNQPQPSPQPYTYPTRAPSTQEPS